MILNYQYIINTVIINTSVLPKCFIFKDFHGKTLTSTGC